MSGSVRDSVDIFGWMCLITLNIKIPLSVLGHRLFTGESGTPLTIISPKNLSTSFCAINKGVDLAQKDTYRPWAIILFVKRIKGPG